MPGPGPDIPACLQVALPVPLPRLFDYLPPESERATPALVGHRVRVPFGNRELVGVVAGIGPPGTDAGLRRASALPDAEPLFAGELLDSLRWLARYTHAPLGEVFATALPAPLRAGEPLPDTHAWAWTLTEAGATGRDGLRKAGRPHRLAALLAAGPVDEDRLEHELDGWREAARALARRGYAERIAVPAVARAPAPAPGPEPNPEQREAIDAIARAGGFAPLLLEGVTGSGKTEVYLHAIADCLARGRQALVLVPEIGLTPQTLARFRARLGVPVHALHSGLADGERARVWAAAWRGEARVIVGTRSAVFIPLPEAGLIVVDEEHDASYKQQDGIRYHARDFALVRGKALGVPVLLGSATPSLETLHNAQAGRYAHLRLRRRAGEARPPAVRVLDVRKRPLQAGLAPETLEAIGAALRDGGQVLVFKNRRGYAPVLLCHDCGWSAQCPRCSTPAQSTPLTVHAGGGRLLCHHCGHRQAKPLACPDCASLALQPQGIGTERLEELLAERFAGWPVLRIDRGTTQRRDGLARLLAELGDRPGILVGTQILAKGHDLPNLTRVVVVGVDEGLFSSDFRAGEKLAQQLIQVAGRAGRAQRAGEVWWQTHHPEHRLLHDLINGGYDSFARDELAQREAAGFPPFAHLALLRAEAQQAEAATAFLRAAKAALLDAADPAAPALDLHGPLTAPMPRRAGLYRMQLLLSSPSRPALHARLDAALPAIHALPEARRTRWSLDVDPVDLY
ncbi:primosomal protein N' [Pseudoxanthomonas suwonensis]|uniref:Replication restart protein PriA n=1 Tax=Pseudoxanthomonas suwonensis TaxID=314722 RepID=A0A0E3UNH3_9GAMM|nr:primosomal protein N' [Pseudoxanthomonas suwonensis]AKC86955.1 primosome assembly protein PriA [Pseudoxanthomonas suwonensis]